MTSLPEILDVSRETTERLRELQALLIKWNPAINLVARSTLSAVWERHILDSAQVYRLGIPEGRWADLGSGGGFPGLVVACMAAGRADPLEVTLLEADQRKATFLRTASAHLGLSTRVICDRAEHVLPLGAQTVSARALAALPLLLTYAVRHVATNGRCLFLKGANWSHEVEAARKEWNFDLDVHPSATDAHGAILIVKAITHV